MKDQRLIRESVVEKHFIAVAASYGCVAKKMDGRGWPDRQVLWPVGVAQFVELKRPVGGRFEPLQEKTHDMLRKMEFDVYVLHTKGLVDLYFHETAAKLGVPKKRISKQPIEANEYIRSIRQPAVGSENVVRQARSQDAARKRADDVNRVAPKRRKSTS